MEMRNQIRKSQGMVAAAALLCFAVGAFAQNGTRTEASGKIRKALTGSLTPAVVQHATGQKATATRMVSQKLLVAMPETPAPLLLGSDLLGLAALAFLLRKRMPFQRGRIGAGSTSEGERH